MATPSSGCPPCITPSLPTDYDRYCHDQSRERQVLLPEHVALEAAEEEPLDHPLHPPLADEDNKHEEASEHVAGVDEYKEDVEDCGWLAVVVSGSKYLAMFRNIYDGIDDTSAFSALGKD